MALITIPTAVKIASLDISLHRPGDVRHESPFTGDAVIIRRGNPRWHGRVVFGELETGTADALAVESFIAQLDGSENEFEIPLGPRATSFTATTVASVANDVLTLTAAPTGFAVNTFFRSANRLFVVDSYTSSTKAVTCLPNGLLAATNPVSPATGVRARLMSEDYQSVSRRGFVGPWNFRWQEAI